MGGAGREHWVDCKNADGKTFVLVLFFTGCWQFKLIMVKIYLILSSIMLVWHRTIILTIRNVLFSMISRKENVFYCQNQWRVLTLWGIIENTPANQLLIQWTKQHISETLSPFQLYVFFILYVQWRTRNQLKLLLRRWSNLKALHLLSGERSGCSSSFARSMV